MKNKGFTLIELLAVILVLGILFGLITSATSRTIKSARQKRYAVELTMLTGAVQTYRHEYGTWPDPNGVAGSDTVTNYNVVNDNSVLINKYLKDSGSANPRKIRFISIGDYDDQNGKRFVSEGAISAPGICSPISRTPYTFRFNLTDDTVSVDTNRP